MMPMVMMMTIMMTENARKRARARAVIKGGKPFCFSSKNKRQKKAARECTRQKLNPIGYDIHET